MSSDEELLVVAPRDWRPAQERLQLLAGGQRAQMRARMEVLRRQRRARV